MCMYIHEHGLQNQSSHRMVTTFARSYMYMPFVLYRDADVHVTYMDVAAKFPESSNKTWFFQYISQKRGVPHLKRASRLYLLNTLFWSHIAVYDHQPLIDQLSLLVVG